MKPEYDFSKGNRGALDSSPRGKTRITIRLDNEVIEWFKNQAEDAGGGSYQTEINKALLNHIQRNSYQIEETVRKVIREELSEYVISPPEDSSD